MELRKVIKFGNSSFVVSLPKNWVDKNKLEKGDLVYFNENGNNELVLSPREAGKKKRDKRIVIDIKNKTTSTIKREIMSAYIDNYNLIKIIGDLKSVRPEIDNILHELLALEIMEETPDKIVVKDFLNVNDISLNDVFRRMDLMIRSMLNETENSFDKNMYEKLLQLDKSVNKLTFLIYRVIKLGMKDPEVLKTLKVDNCAELLSYWLIVTNLEGIGDDSKRIGRFLSRSNLEGKEKTELKNLFQIIKSLHLRIMKAYYANDKMAAHNIITELEGHLENLNEVFLNCENKVCGPIIERFKAVDGQLRSIARSIVDKHLEENDKKIQ